MDFNNDVVHLGEYDFQPILDWLLNQPSSEWDKHTFRQDKYGTHKHTKSLFVLCEGFARLNVRNYEFLKAFENHIDFVKERLQNEMCVGDLKLNRLIFPLLSSHGYIRKHTDSGEFLTSNWRCHIPLITNSNVKFTVGDTQKHFKKFNIYLINNQRRHGVINNSDEDRIHMIMDFGND